MKIIKIMIHIIQSIMIVLIPFIFGIVVALGNISESYIKFIIGFLLGVHVGIIFFLLNIYELYMN